MVFQAVVPKGHLISGLFGILNTSKKEKKKKYAKVILPNCF